MLWNLSTVWTCPLFCTSFRGAGQEDQIPIGVIYRKERQIYEKQIPALKEMTLFSQQTDPLQFESVLNEFT
jgi:hypothetical protein